MTKEEYLKQMEEACIEAAYVGNKAHSKEHLRRIYRAIAPKLLEGLEHFASVHPPGFCSAFTEDFEHPNTECEHQYESTYRLTLPKELSE